MSAPGTPTVSGATSIPCNPKPNESVQAFRPYDNGTVTISWAGIGDGDRNGYYVQLATYNGTDWVFTATSGWLARDTTSYQWAIPEGYHYVYIVSRDDLGNQNASASYKFVIDKTAPRLSVTAKMPEGTPGNATVVNSLDLTIVSQDNPGSGYPVGVLADSFKYKLLQRKGSDVFEGEQNLSDPDDVLVYTAVLSYPYGQGFDSGVYEWTFMVSDKLGNAAQQVKITKTLLLNKPEIGGLPAASASGWYTTTNQLTVTAKDNMERLHVQNPDLVHLYYSTDGKATWTAIAPQGGDWSPYNTGVDGDGKPNVAITFAEGKHTVYLRVTDEAGNSKEEDMEFNVDTVEPELALAVNGVSADWAWQPVYHINSDTDVSALFVSDATSGIMRLGCVRDKGSADEFVYADLYVNQQTEGEAVTDAAVTTFAPAEGAHTYTFILSDMAGNQTVRMVRLLKDTTAIAAGDISFRLTDENRTTPAQGTVTDSNALGNFSQLELVVKDQGTQGAQAQSYLWTLDGTEQAGGEFAANAPYAVTLIPGLIAEGEHTVVVTVKDKAGNVTIAEEFKFTADRTAPALCKQWITLADDGGTATMFGVVPAEADTNIRVYQTAADYALAGAEAKMLWDNGTVTEPNGEAAAGSFALSGGTGVIYLAAIDPAGNRAQAAYKVVRPTLPPCTCACEGGERRLQFVCHGSDKSSACCGARRCNLYNGIPGCGCERKRRYGRQYCPGSYGYSLKVEPGYSAQRRGLRERRAG